MNNIIAVCPGSFDPVTVGHIDIIHRAASMFSKVVVVVMKNTAKSPLFTAEERAQMIRESTTDLPNVTVDVFDGLLADYTKAIGAGAIVKGLRAMSDFEYEFQMALANRKLNPELDTVFLMTSAEYMYLSSSIVKDIAVHGGGVADFVPEGIMQDIVRRIRKGE